MPKRTAQQIYNAFLEAEHLLLVPHKNPDGDALGSVTALADFFKRIQKPYTIFCATEIPESLAFLPYADEVTQNENVWFVNKNYTVVLVDTGDVKHAGVDTLIPKLKNKPVIINIDHHATNEEYGTLNLVLEGASSTTEVLYMLFRYNHVEITEEMATSLMTGLITDTGNFSNAGTSKNALAIASDLSKKHANITDIRNHVFKNKSVNALRLWGKILSRLALHAEHNIAYTYFTQKEVDDYNVSEEELDGIANLLNHLNEGHAILVLKEQKEGGVKASMRTTKDNVDVSLIAKTFGGGGHKKAAGFSLEHSIEEAFEHIFETLTVQQVAFVKE